MPERGVFDVFPAEEKRGIFGNISRRSKWIILIIALVLFALGGYLFFRWDLSFRPQDEGDVARETVSGQPQSGKSAASRSESAPAAEPSSPLGSTNYQSENFRMGDITLGGEAEFLLTEGSPDPVEISAIRGETFTEKNKQEVKLMLSWKTNKLTKSEISYSKGSGQAKKTASEEEYGFSHSLIIPGLDQASTYIYTIASEDRFGNSATSDSHAVYTGSKTVSLFDLIADAAGDVFGWAVKRK